jgi:crossover junction endodeoxyribonuclease RuvC
LTRCGFGIVDGAVGRKLSLVHVEVVRTDADLDLGARLAAIDDAIGQLVRTHRPDQVAVERVFSQHNVRTVMATAQAAGVCVLAAHRAGLPVATFTPSEVKAAVTGDGRAEKPAVGAMVRRLLALDEVPRPADAADALALAICDIWRGTALARQARAAGVRAVTTGPGVGR